MDKATLRKVQLTQLEILKEFDRVCKKNEIPYILSSGTLLGAVRHKGFIPWDDDLDVDMTRENYEKFLKCIDDFGSGFSVQNWHTDPQFALPFTKIRMNNTIFREANSAGLNNCGIYIDLFPWDKTNGSRSEKRRFKKLIMSYLILLHNEPAYDISNQSKKLRLLLSVLSVPFRGEKGRKRLIASYEKCAEKYEALTDGYKYFENTAATRIGDWQLEPSVFEKTAPMLFEDSYFPCPAEYDKYLTMSYGDYMTPPPEDKRDNRHDITEIVFASDAMDKTAAVYRGIVNLARAALNGQAQNLPNGFELSDMLPITKKHQCENLFYYGALNCDIPQTDPSMRELSESMLRCYAVNENQVFECKRLFDAFEENKVEYLPLKGSVLKSLYPKEDMRMMGDIDILIPVDKLTQIRAFLEKMGYVFYQESAHEIIFRKGALQLELHKCLIPPYHKDLYQFFGDGWQMACRTEGAYRCALSDENTYLYLFSHFSKHFRDGGIGIRHLTDLWVWRQTHPDMDLTLIDKGLKMLHLQEFHQNILQTLEAWFADAEATEMTDFITEYILSSGVFGQTERRRIGAATVNASDAKSARQVQSKNILSLIFPRKELLVKDYPVLKKCGWLLPAIWVIRAFKAIFVKGSVPMHTKRLKQLSASSIRKYQESLNYVGLQPEGEEKT